MTGQREHEARLSRFDVQVCEDHEGWHVHIYIDGKWRAATHGPDVDTTLKMAVPYLASYCEPDPFPGLTRAMKAGAS